MALIKCPECGKEISDKAQKCIHCGYPLKSEQLDINITSDEDVKKHRNQRTIRNVQR